MCIAAPGEITEIKGKEVWVSYPGLSEPRKALAPLMALKKGDLVLVQMGIVVQVLSKEESDEVRKAWAGLQSRLNERI